MNLATIIVFVACGVFLMVVTTSAASSSESTANSNTVTSETSTVASYSSTESTAAVSSSTSSPSEKTSSLASSTGPPVSSSPQTTVASPSTTSPMSSEKLVTTTVPTTVATSSRSENTPSLASSTGPPVSSSPQTTVASPSTTSSMSSEKIVTTTVPTTVAIFSSGSPETQSTASIASTSVASSLSSKPETKSTVSSEPSSSPVSKSTVSESSTVTQTIGSSASSSSSSASTQSSPPSTSTLIPEECACNGTGLCHDNETCTSCNNVGFDPKTNCTSCMVGFSGNNCSKIDYCANPAQACNFLGPFTCVSGLDQANCMCQKGFYNNSNICTVENSVPGIITLNDLPYIADYNDHTSVDYMWLVGNITETLSNVFEGNPNVLSETVVDVFQSSSTSSNQVIRVKRQATADAQDGVSVRIKMTVKDISTNSIEAVNYELTTYTNSCDNMCFSFNSNATYTQEKANGPCQTSPDVCQIFANTKCFDNLSTENVNPLVQYECKCNENVAEPTNETFIANSGLIYGCQSLSVTGCTSNPCQNGGNCVPTTTFDGYACQCPWTYMGNTCDNPLPLALVIVASILGFLTLVLLAGLIYSIVKSKKRISSSSTNWEPLADRVPAVASAEGRDNKAYENTEGKVSIPRPKYKQFTEERL